MMNHNQFKLSVVLKMLQSLYLQLTPSFKAKEQPSLLYRSVKQRVPMGMSPNTNWHKSVNDSKSLF